MGLTIFLPSGIFDVLWLSRVQVGIVTEFSSVGKVLKYFVLVSVDASASQLSLYLIVNEYYMRMQC